ncbi:MAG: hypothetical protein H6953_11710 [Chromatiaceae bacterium]|nr:hypothetical protein [Chromatiaceae bacterium]MCP5315987.1 hypothetical protein [Chromatiaceae bacterium]
MSNVIQLKPATTEYFGGCPRCGKTDGYLSIGRDHYFVCDAHRTYWYAGSNLFSSWRKETEADWQRNRNELAGYRQVEPVMPLEAE